MSLVQTNNVVLLLTIMKMVMMSDGAMYKVGDSAGWTSIGDVDYKNWASSKNINVGDTIIFEYSPGYHNVMRVTSDAFKSCDVSTTNPLETFNTGNDSIKINNYGHHFFICGFPGHCQKGQKVDINVIRASSTNPPPSSSNDDDYDECPCSGKAAPFMVSFGLIGLAMSLFGLVAF